MTLHVNLRGDRIVCRWKEPVKVRMANREGIIDKVRTLNLTVDRQGRLLSRDRKRHGQHPMFSHAQNFRDRLEEIRFFSEQRFTCACDHCGRTSEVLPFYDPKKKELAWRCIDTVQCQSQHAAR